MDKRYGFDWTDAAIERLKALWFSGYSARQIGQVLGVSRNSVIGKAHRLGWTGMRRKRRPQLAIEKKVAALDAPPSEPKPARPPIARLLKTPEQVSKQPAGLFTLTLLELGPRHCRWPQGDGPWTFCGRPKVEGSSYCSEHQQLSSSGPRPIPHFMARAA